MVILIGGSSHVGKTFLAQQMLEKTHFPYLSLDHLKMGMIRTGMTSLTVEDDYEMRYFLWPIAAEMIKTVIENKQNLIIEGCYIPKEWRRSFTEEYLSEIRCVFIVMSEAYLRSHFDSICGCANVIEQRIADEPDMERLIKCSQYFKADCLETGTPYLEIDGDYDFANLLADAEKILLKA